jgi:DNA-binding winged helix-turn-helix (wHTH) protein
MLARETERILPAERLHIETPASVTDRPPIDLAQEPPFRLGELAVAPPLRELTAPDGTHQTLEPRVMQVLVALARANGAIVSRAELIRTCWNGTVVGEDSINRTISLLRRASEGIDCGAFRIETVPKVGYRLVLPRPEPAATPARSRRLAWAALALLVAGLAATLPLWRPAPAGPTYSVHVQPFRTAGAARGFDDELMSALTSQDVPTAGGRIGLILTGSAEERDGMIRVNAHLADPDSDEVVWSGTIERAPAGRAGLAGAATIVGSVAQCTLAGVNDAAGAIPRDILSGYARTCELGARGQIAQGVRAARELTHEAPDFAPGWFALSYHASELYFRQPRYDPALREEALAAANKLIALRPDAQDGYASKYLAMDPAKTLERERLLLRATKLEPIYADVAQSYLGDFLLQAGRLEEAFQQYRALQQQKPESASAHGAVFTTAVATGRWPVAEQALARVRRLEPAAMPRLLWRKAVWAQDWAEAERLMPVESTAQKDAGAAAYRALASGDRAKKDAAARLVGALPADCCQRLQIELLAQLGHPTEAIALLGRFEAARAPGSRRGLSLLWDPALRPLWDDPALEPVLRRSGWLAYWTGAKVTPDLCGEATPPPFCRLLND